MPPSTRHENSPRLVSVESGAHPAMFLVETLSRVQQIDTASVQGLVRFCATDVPCSDMAFAW